jgi:hypothetical protein
MSERISETELREIEARGVAAIPGAPMPPSHVVREDYRSLTAEVRRLRGTILAEWLSQLDDPDGGTSEAFDAEARAIDAEAEAIRRESEAGTR